MDTPKVSQIGDSSDMEPIVQQEQQPIARTSPAQQYSMDSLESALIDVDDVFSRAAVPYFIIGQTAKQIKHNEQLSGTGIDVGVRRNELTPEVRSTIKQFQPTADFEAEGFEYLWLDCPVRVHWIDPEDSFFKSADIVWHNAWEYRIPNPWVEYEATL